ncbi:MAG: hypothetical protein Q9206_000664 [Seirophora lacunosa]
MQTTHVNGVHTLAVRPFQEHSHPALPAPPSPSADAGNAPQITSPSKEIADPEFVPLVLEMNIFQMSPLAASKMLVSTVEALIKITGDVPPTSPIRSTPRPTVVSAQKENIRTASRSSSVDRRKSQAPPPPAWADVAHVPEKAKTPIGSPESKPTETLHVEVPDPQPLDNQLHAISRKFNSKRPPTIMLKEYLLRLHKYCPATTAVYLATGLYIYRLAIIQRTVPVTVRNAHRLVLAALRVSGKANDDRNYPHQRFAEVGGVSPSELGKLEIAFCFVTNFALRVTTETLQEYAKDARDLETILKGLKESRVRMPEGLERRSLGVEAIKKETKGTETEASAAA